MNIKELDKIRIRAYKLWQDAGEPDGSSEEFWIQAENEIKAQLEKTQKENTKREEETMDWSGLFNLVVS